MNELNRAPTPRGHLVVGRVIIGLAVVAAIAWLAAPARALDLETVLGQVAKANPTLAASRATVDAAREKVGPAGAWASPMVDFGLMNVPVGGGFDEQPMTMKSVGVTQSIPLFGSNGLRRQAAREMVSASTSKVVMTHYELYGAAWETYAGAYFAGAMVREVERHRDVMDRMQRAARARYESASGRLDDVLRAEAMYARTLADLSSFQADEEAARARLDALRGMDTDASADTLAPPPAPETLADLSAWTAAIDGEHPMLRELDAMTAMSHAKARAARRATLPDLRVRAAYGFRDDLKNGVQQDDMWTASVGFELPLFAGQRQLAEAKAMDAEAEVATDKREAERLRLVEMVRRAYAAALDAQRTIGLLADTVVATQERALEASWSAYSAGTIDLWRVLEAEHTLYLENIHLLRVRQRRAQALARLLAVTTRADLLGIQIPADR